MAIEFDAQNSEQVSGSATCETTDWTISGTNRILIAAMCWADSSPTNYSEIRWGGSGGTLLTQIGSTLAIGSFHRVALAYLINPSAATQKLWGQLTGAQNEFCVGGISFKGVHQSSPLGTEATNSGTGTGSTFSSTVNVSSASGELVVAVSIGGSTAGGTSSCTVTVGAGQSATDRWEEENMGGGFSAGTMSTEGGAATVTMSENFTFSVSDDFAWGIIGVPLKPADTGTKPMFRGQA